MGLWLGLLGGCVVFGAAIVGALVLPRGFSLLAGVVGLACMFVSVTALGSIAQRYDTPEAIGGALIILIAGITAGYAVAATALPLLSDAGRPATGDVAADSADSHADEAVVLLCDAEPEGYSPRAIAARHNLLSDGAQIDIPPTALPFVFYAEKARYRAAGGRSPGPAAARLLATRVAASLGADPPSVSLAWSHTAASLSAAVESLSHSGARRISIVVVGAAESGPLDEAQTRLDRLVRSIDGLSVAYGPPVWGDRFLPSQLARRIMSAAGNAPPDEVGVVLVGEGAPPVWERRFSEAGATENYFNQRVRSLLGETGLDERRVRVAWLNWQTPDVTEAVRHVAVVGCTRIIVAPSTLALPSLETVLDLGHAVDLARVPDGVHVITLPAWAEDDEFGDAVGRSAATALEELRRLTAH